MPVFAQVYLLFWVAGLVLVAVIAIWGYIFWDRRYRGAGGRDNQFQPTNETFRDPSTGHMVRVFFNPATGERQYRET
jgi:hypothetical protein